MNPASVGRTVRWARKRAAMTQNDLADAVRMPQSSIARIERGIVIPRTATLIVLLRATGHQIVVEPIGPSVSLEAIRQRLGMDVPARTWSALGRAVARNPRRSPIRILRRLRLFGVAFVLIGELAEAAHGSPVKVKRMIEICHSRTDVVRGRLGRALEDLGATSSDGVEFSTEAGRLRLTTEAATGDDYDLLARTAVRMHVDTGILIPVASLDDLIRIRVARGGPEDRLTAALLRAIGDAPHDLEHEAARGAIGGA
ncbi:MAG: helix-turn-helix transcriptional regulator [Chloroflexi bacterium]|nr:helix-turn-helix transcriptional regulator [Chloroflexota bacterium]